jgi:hypothetical protein
MSLRACWSCFISSSRWLTCLCSPCCQAHADDREYSTEPKMITKSNLLVECRPQRLEFAHNIASLGVVLVYLGTVEVPTLLGWPHHAQALGNARQRVVCHCNGRKQERSRRVCSASRTYESQLPRCFHPSSRTTCSSVLLSSPLPPLCSSPPPPVCPAQVLPCDCVLMHVNRPRSVARCFQQHLLQHNVCW